ncbi:hypothetical protein LTR27_012416 [Elasticomyces elasticus]|nr:hypothetical protein LTR27_012416 [Elasticomyces elasticus]
MNQKMTATLSSFSTALPKLDGLDQSSTSAFEAFKLPEGNQRELGPPHQPATVSPLALRSTQQQDNPVTLDGAVQAIKALQAQGGILTQKLATHGTLLFRGLPVYTAHDFSKFAHAFGFQAHEIIGIVVNRPELAPNVAPANEAPPTTLIGSHNESPQVPHAPEYIFFYCHKAPEVGGETPISSSLELFYRVQQELPDFTTELAQKGILSSVTYKVEKQHSAGSTLRQAFGKEIVDGDDAATKRAKIEAQIARYCRGEHTTWEWQDDGNTLTVVHRLSAIRTQPGTNLPSLFTNLAAYYKLLMAGGKAPRVQTFGDGTPVPGDVLKRVAEITDEIKVLHKWQEGYVLVYDNVIAQHGRQPWVGEQGDRLVLASLFDGERLPGPYSDADWAQVVPAREALAV